MSAREKILRYVKENQSFIDLPCDPETGFFVDDLEAHVQSLLDAFARELAEQIRASKGSGNYEPAALFRGGMDYAADLIDPEA